MANTMITDVAQMLAATNANLYTELQTTATKAAEGSDFSKIMNEATKSVEGAGDATKANNDSMPEKNITTVDKSGTKEIKDAKPEKKDVVNSKEDRKSVATDAVKTANKITDTIKESFDISEEELVAVMENLGMTLQDVLDPSKLNDLMLELAGVSDSISLLTNADLYASVKEVMQVAQVETAELLNNNGIDISELSLVLDDEEAIAEAIENVASEVAAGDNQMSGQFADILAESQAGVNQVDDEAKVQDAAVSQIEVSVTGAETLKTTDTNKVDVNEKINDNTNSVAANDEPKADLGPSETFTEVAKTESEPMKGRNEGFENASRFGLKNREESINTNESVNFAETVTTKTEVNSVGDIVETVTRYSNADADSIMSQVTQSIRVNFSQDTTQLEMMLHPASLGTVNMQLTSANGVITAHLLVQDEAVKAAIESQLLALQETFEQQGQKVEAVEVSIANYDLNKGMNQNEQQQQQEAKDNNGFRIGGRRRININAMDDIDGEEITEAASEEERIARDMMARNGNTLDYTV